MSKNKQKLKFLKKEMSRISIDLKIFLLNYCGIYNENLFNNKVRHKDIKELLPNLRRVSFDSLIGDIKKLYNGEIIAVRDSFGYVLPYINPKIDIIDIDYSKINNDFNQEKEVENHTIDKNLSIEELIILCKRLKQYRKIQQYREVSKLLKNKIEQEEYCKVKQYKREKNNLRMRGREENEEY